MAESKFGQFIAQPFRIYPPDLARALTEWLYDDPSNPVRDDPKLWEKGPQVQSVNRTLQFGSLSSGASSTQRLSIVGGRNAVVVSRSAVVIPAELGSPPVVLPNERSSFVNVEVKRTDGFAEVEDQPMSLAWGTMPGIPYQPPAPARWTANVDRVIKVTNNTGATASVYLSWLVYILDTGR